MGPKKTKRKGRNQDEQELENQNSTSKWAQALQQNVNQSEPDAEQLYVKPNKAIFDFDFSNQRALDLSQQQPVKPQKDKYADFTAQELEQLKILKQKAKVDKELKNKIKNERKKQRQKEVEVQKELEKAEKQKQAQQAQKVENQIKKSKRKEGSPWIIPGILFLFLILMFVLQYQKQIYERLSKFQGEYIDFYEILEADQSVAEKQLKGKYKKLVMKYHPDRNPDCQNCKEKFDKIMKAWEVLGDPQKRKQYDQNSGFIVELKSASTTLTPHNYPFLVEESPALWIIQVFDSTNTYSRYFAQFWEELVTNYGDFVKFGRIDIWHQSQMSSYIPYKFQVFPSVYFLDQGYSQICSFNFQRPTEGLKKCVEQALSRHDQKVLQEVPEKNLQKQSNKINVYLDGKLRANLRLKAYNRMLDNYFEFYFVENDNLQKQAIIFFQDKRYIYSFKEVTKKSIRNYSQFLQNFIVQEISACAFLHYCEQQKCILVLNKTRIQEVKRNLPLVKQNSEKFPIFMLGDYAEELQIKIDQIKPTYENFEIGVYMGGRIDLGYANEADELIPQQGERFDIECKARGWRELFTSLVTKVSNLFQS